MKKNSIQLLVLKAFFLGLLLSASAIFAQKSTGQKSETSNATGFTDAASFGFSSLNTGIENVKALQAAVDKGGTILITKPGIYKLANTIYIGDSTSLVFGKGVVIQKSAEPKAYTHVFINKGAISRTYNYSISLIGLNLSVNNVDKWMDEIFGLRGQVAFFYIKDLKIEGFRCTDISKGQFCMHICTFEDLIIDDGIFRGVKDGIHLGRGKRFRISNCVFQTADDAIAIAAGGWVTGNPEIGNIEGGIVENCYDLEPESQIGTFAKIGAGAWIDWKPGMIVKNGDPVVSGGKIYRVIANSDDKTYTSSTQPTFEKGTMQLDGIKWMMYQKDTFHLAVTRDVVFRDIYCQGKRNPFQIICYSNGYCHSYYPGAPIPVQSGIVLDNIIMKDKFSLASISSPLDNFTIKNSTLGNCPIVFSHAADFDVYPKTSVNISNCTFINSGLTTIIKNSSPKKMIYLKTSGSLESGENFSATIDQGTGTIKVDSDLSGLKK